MGIDNVFRWHLTWVSCWSRAIIQSQFFNQSLDVIPFTCDYDIVWSFTSAGTKTYLLCRSNRHAFTSTFCNTLPVGCLKFCFSFKIFGNFLKVLQFGLLPSPSKMIELKPLLFPVWPIAMHTGQQLHTKMINFYRSQLCMALCISGLLQSDLSIWNDRKFTNDYVAMWLTWPEV